MIAARAADFCFLQEPLFCFVLFCFCLFVCLFVYSVSAFLRKNRNGSKTGHTAGMVDY